MQLPELTSQMPTVLSSSRRGRVARRAPGDAETGLECPSRMRIALPGVDVPDSHGVVIRARERESPVGAPGHARDGAGVPFEDAECIYRTRRPRCRTVLSHEPERASRRRGSRPRSRRCRSVLRGRGGMSRTRRPRFARCCHPSPRGRGAVGAPGHAPDEAGVPFEDAEARSGLDVPDAHGVVIRARESESSVGVPGHAPDGAGVPSRGRGGSSRTRRPRCARCCRGARESESSVGAPGHARDRVGVPFEDAEACSGLDVPDATVLSYEPGESESPVGAPGTLQTESECPSRTRRQFRSRRPRSHGVVERARKSEPSVGDSRPRSRRSWSALQGRGGSSRTSTSQMRTVLSPEPERASSRRGSRPR